MKIDINHTPTEVAADRPLIEELRRLGHDIPSLCYDKDARHQASCMVCMVKDVRSGQMIPSCSTLPTEGMSIETDSEEVQSLRKMALDLLIGDHRADCLAPCSVVCPHGIDPAKRILAIDRGQSKDSKGQESGKDSANRQEQTPAEPLPCQDCAAPCEKACRRKRIDRAVDIRNVLSGQSTEESRCLHCACEGIDKCRLRELAAAVGLKPSIIRAGSPLPLKECQHITGRLYFEPAKCIRCGLCVYNTADGFTFLGRGFGMQVVIPEESKAHVPESIANLCPTGALFLRKQ